MAVTIKTSRTDINANINSVDDAKNYGKYNGKPLDNDSDKEIFDDLRLKIKKPDGSLEDDLDKIRDTAELLSAVKESQVVVKTEKMGLSDNGHALMLILLRQQKADSDAYHLVNESGQNGRVDKVISKFESVLFAESEPEFNNKIQAAFVQLNELDTEGEKIDKEIKKLRKSYNDELVKKQTDLEKKVSDAVKALKIDIDIPWRGGRRFLDAIVEKNKKVANMLLRSDTPATPDNYGSIIKTGYNDNGKPFTHPLYLVQDLPGQIWTILKEIDKDKLFKYISSSDCSWTNDQKKKFKRVFSRVVDWKSGGFINNGAKNRISQLHIFNSKKVLSSIKEQGKEELKRAKFYISDVFYIMDALFPKDSDYKDSPFLKTGESSCLQFKGNKNLDSDYTFYWRGNDDEIIGKSYVAESGNASILKAPFPFEEKKLTWANGQIPEFFWQVYNNPEATDFSVYYETISKDGVTPQRVREEPISVYEKKILAEVWREGGSMSKMIGNTLIVSSYQEYVEEFLKNLKGADGNNLFTEEEVIELGSEWKGVVEDLSSKLTLKTYANFRNKAKQLTNKQLKDWEGDFRLPKEHMEVLDPKKLKPEVGVTDDMKKIWERWDNDTKTKGLSLEEYGRKLGDELIKRNAVDAKIKKFQQELDNAKEEIKNAKERGMRGLKDTFNAIYPKTNRTWKERMFLKSLLGLIEQWQRNYPELYPIDASFDVATYKQEMDAEDQRVWGVLAPYCAWEQRGDNFVERLKDWEVGDGLYLTEETKKNEISKIKDALESVGLEFLSPVQQNELQAITDWINEVPPPADKRITPSDLKDAFGLGFNVFWDTTQQWIDYPSSINFKGDAEEIRRIADKVNKGDKIKKLEFTKYLREVLSKRSDLAENYPGDKAAEKEILMWFFSLSPETVIKTIAERELVADKDLKLTIIKEMKDQAEKQGDDKLDVAKYGINEKGEFTEEGIAKFYYEKLGGLNHSFAKQGTKTTPTSKEGFWRTNNLAAWLSGMGLLLLLAGTIWAILKRKTLLQWWNAPSELEEELDEDEEED